MLEIARGSFQQHAHQDVDSVAGIFMCAVLLTRSEQGMETSYWVEFYDDGGTTPPELEPI